MTQTPRVRFAPSPTGYLHVGGLRTALYNFLFARKTGGAVVLRIEDTDRSRLVEGAAEGLAAALAWAGIAFDEGPAAGGVHGPYTQSERLPLYRDHAGRLLAGRHAYRCFCTPERLEEMRRRQEKEGAPKKYDRRCLALPGAESDGRAARGEPFVIRLRVPDGGETAFTDLVRGEVAFANDALDDQVLMKSDGYPTYHLANVVDDHAMAITHVIRGEEWLSSTPKHLLLYRAFGWDPPAFAHLPLLLNPDRSKLSKRQGDVAVEDFRAQGYLPEALVNFVALLGWNPGTEQEIFTLGELIGGFSLERVNKSGAVFNREKLDWLNTEHLRRKSDAELAALVADDLGRRGIAPPRDGAYLLRVVAAMRERATFVGDFAAKGAYFFAPPREYDPETVKKRWTAMTPGQLRALAEAFAALPLPDPKAYEGALEATAARLGVNRGALIHPLRLALSGVGGGPGVYDILDILGREESLRRIDTAIAALA